MKSSLFALTAALALGGTAFVAGGAGAQRIDNMQKQNQNQKQAQPQQAQAQPGSIQAQGRTLQISAEERAALGALEAVMNGTDRGAQDDALAIAKATAQSPDARYAAAHFQIRIAEQRQDMAMRAEGVDALIDSGVAGTNELLPLLLDRATRAFSARDFATADAALTRVLELQPDNISIVTDLSQVKARQGDRAAAIRLLQRAIEMHRTAGTTVPEDLYRRSLGLAYEERTPQSLELARNLVQAYPTPTNWRDALIIYRELSRPNDAAMVDILRLMRATGAMNGAADYVNLAISLNEAGLPGETKAVLEEGISRGMVNASEPDVRQLMALANSRIAEDRASLAQSRTQALAASAGRPARATADAFFGYGQYREAAELYRAALEKGGEDANLLNLRLGASLALAGQRAEAEAALRAVTGPRVELANFWLLWLARNGG